MYMLKQTEKEVAIMEGTRDFIIFNREEKTFTIKFNENTIFVLDNSKENLRKATTGYGFPSWLTKQFKEAIKESKEQFIAKNSKAFYIG